MPFLMEKSEDKSLVPRSPDGGVAIGGKGQRLIKRMNEDALATIEAPQQDLAPVMRRLGDYELRKEDYVQLHIWAQDFTERGDAITALQLANNLATQSHIQVSAWIERGRIKVADFTLLRYVYEIKQLDLNNVPALSLLGCTGADLTKLDLRKLPELTELSCCNNRLTKLNLSKLTALSELSCSQNYLTELDLTNVPALTWLVCSYNHLTELDIANLSELAWLACDDNKLTSLDLTNNHELTFLRCRNNQLAELDIRNCHKLSSLSCDSAVRIIKNPDQNIQLERV